MLNKFYRTHFKVRAISRNETILLFFSPFSLKYISIKADFTIFSELPNSNVFNLSGKNLIVDPSVAFYLAEKYILW